MSASQKDRSYSTLASSSSSRSYSHFACQIQPDKKVAIFVHSLRIPFLLQYYTAIHTVSHFSSPMFHIDILFTSGNRGNTYSTYSFLFKVGFGPPSHA